MKRSNDEVPVSSSVCERGYSTKQNLSMAESKTDKEAESSPPAEDPFLCSICLDPFTDPVTTPCGHNFCKNCITGHWNMTERCVCPVCREAFNTKPELRVNTLLSEMTARFRQTAPATSISSNNNNNDNNSSSSSNPEQPAAKPEEVLCDICPEPKLKAIKSCQVCLVSYCETHLNPHLTVAVLKRHKLMEPVENLEGRMCVKHDKLLELFCRTDQTCVCMLCMVLDHKNHDVVSLKEECEEKKAELVKTEAEVQQMIQERQQKIQEMKQSVKLGQTNADKAIAQGRHVCTDVKDSVDRSLDELTKTIKETQKTTEKQAEEFIKELEKEISELKKKSSVMKQLSQSEDHHHLLQSVLSPSTVCHLPSTKDWTDISICPASFDKTVANSVIHLEKTCDKRMKKLLIEIELKRVCHVQ